MIVDIRSRCREYAKPASTTYELDHTRPSSRPPDHVIRPDFKSLYPVRDWSRDELAIAVAETDAEMRNSDFPLDPTVSDDINRARFVRAKLAKKLTTLRDTRAPQKSSPQAPEIFPVREPLPD